MSASSAKWTRFGVLAVAALSVACVAGCVELCGSVCRALGCLAFLSVGGVAVVSRIRVSRATDSEGDSRSTVSFHPWGLFSRRKVSLVEVGLG